MVQVKGSTGKLIDIQVLGISNVIRMLLAKGQQINQGADFGVVRAGGFIEEEVKESIMGNRAEPKSVDTGLFANSVEFEKISDSVGIVKSNPTHYPGTTTTTEDVATILEFGTSSIDPRHHFTNTKSRTADKVKEIIDSEIKQKL